MSDSLIDRPLPPSDESADRGFRMDLRLSRAEALVTLSGEVDLTARDAVSTLLDSLDVLTYAVVRVDMAGVSFLDSAALEPLVRVARARAERGSQPLIWEPISAPVRRLLRALDMAPTPEVDVAAWDASGSEGSLTARPTVRPRPEAEAG